MSEGTHLYIPDVATVDKTQQHVVCPARHFEDFLDETTGYFLDNNGDLDSLMIDWEDDPTDDYYIWVVNYAMPLKHVSPLSPHRSEGDPCGDGHCDRSTEDESTCPNDCDPILNPSGVKEVYQIKLTSIEVYNDQKPYIESWLSNRYDFAFAGCVFDNNYDILTSRGHILLSGLKNDPIAEFSVKRHNACRKNGVKSWNCPSNSLALNEVIVDDFRDGENLMLLGYEYNRENVFKHPHQFAVSHPDFTYGSADGIYYWMWTGRNNKSVNPFYEEADEVAFPLSSANPITQPPPLDYQAAIFDVADMITLNSFTGAGSFITIDNGEWKYTLQLLLK